MWFISIIISIIISIFFYFGTLSVSSNIFNDFFAEATFQNFNIFHPNIKVSVGFPEIRANIILKEILFIIINLIIHFTDSLTVTIFYVLVLIFTWRLYLNRVKEINNLGDGYSSYVPFIKKAYKELPAFQTILFILCYLTYMLNKV